MNRYSRSSGAKHRSARLVLATISLFAAAQLHAGDSPEQFFSYPLRAGESLSAVSQIFNVPVPELIELNQIADPSQLHLGQILKVPNTAANSVARAAATLRAEHNRLLEEQGRSEGQFAERRKTMANMESRLHQVEAENAAMGRQVTAKAAWENAAKLLAVLLLASVCWAVKARADRVIVKRRLSSLAAENAVLAAARAMYRSVASQLELRYQKLYGPKGEAGMRKVVDDGVSGLTRTFREGTAEVEQLLAKLGGERESEKQVLESAPWAFAWLVHPVRETLLRERIKYYTS